jgi:DNA (cytosine-5)-methyltransferase 1
MRLGELFAGYGGLGMAVEEVFGAELAWVSEWETAPSKILAHHWPHVPNHGDITKIDWANIEPVDIISGGSPCQDLSLAGKRRGMTDGTRSNLWESMREGIATIKPKYVVWENVRGALNAEATSASDMGQREGFLGQRGGRLRALGRVLGDLADLGYDAEWRGLRAADVGAPHGRYRIFVLAADASDIGRSRDTEPHSQPQQARSGAVGEHAARRDLAHERVGAWRHPAPMGKLDWGIYEPAVRRWETLHRAAPSPVEPADRGGLRLSPRFAEWMMGLPEGWVTDRAIGITRNDQLKACGNGVVPQQAAAALQDMLRSFERQDVAA